MGIGMLTRMQHGAFGRSTRHWRRVKRMPAHIKPITVEEKARCMGGYQVMDPRTGIYGCASCSTV
jgi:hypothetical protein